MRSQNVYILPSDKYCSLSAILSPYPTCFPSLSIGQTFRLPVHLCCLSADLSICLFPFFFLTVCQPIKGVDITESLGALLSIIYRTSSGVASDVQTRAEA